MNSKLAYAMLDDETKESIFNDLYDAAGKEAKDAIVRKADLMDDEAGAMLIIGVTGGVYGDAVAAAVNGIERKNSEPGDYKRAAAILTLFDEVIGPEIEKMRGLIAKGRADRPEIAELLDMADSTVTILRGEEEETPEAAPSFSP